LYDLGNRIETERRSEDEFEYFIPRKVKRVEKHPRPSMQRVRKASVSDEPTNKNIAHVELPDHLKFFQGRLFFCDP